MFFLSKDYFLLLYKHKLLILNSLLKTFYFTYIFIMAVKKTTSKKATSTVAKKPATKSVVTPIESSVKKDSIMNKATVETKKTDRCECNEKCNCSQTHGLILKIIILILLILNIVISCFFLCKKSAYSLEVLKLGWKENMENVVNNLYKNQNYINAQKEEINAYLEQLWVN